MQGTEWAGILGQIVTIITSGGITGVSMMVLAFTFLSKGVLVTRSQVRSIEEGHAQALKNQETQYENRIKELAAGKDEAMTIVKTQLAESQANEKTLKEALALERGAKDDITSKVLEGLVPVLQVTNKHLEGIETIAKGGDPEA